MQNQIHKEWGSMADATKISGIKRGTLYTLLRAGRIKTASLTEPGKKRGVRLVHIPSLLSMIENHIDIR